MTYILQHLTHTYRDAYVIYRQNLSLSLYLSSWHAFATSEKSYSAGGKGGTRQRRANAWAESVSACVLCLSIWLRVWCKMVGGRMHGHNI